MSEFVQNALIVVETFFLLYLLLYASYLLLSVAIGAWHLYQADRMRTIKNELKHNFYFPVSVLVPAHNEEVTILDSVKSLLELDYQLYEIVVVDDGSTDNTVQVLIDHFHMQKVSRPIRRSIPCKDIRAIYEAPGTQIQLDVGVEVDALGHPDQAAHGHHVVVLHNGLDDALQGVPLEDGVGVDAQEVGVLGDVDARVQGVPLAAVLLLQ